MIFKIQQPISSDLPESEHEALIYNQDRSIEFEIPMSKMKQLFLDAGGRAKVFVDADIDEDEGFLINRFVLDEPW